MGTAIPLPEEGTGIAIGDLVGGRYRVERLLGRGAMGIVLAARRDDLDRLVALKLLPARAADDPVLSARFLREARAAARLSSEHVVKVLDVGTLPAGAPYMVMEHLDGEDLEAVLARGRLAPGAAAEWVAQACEGVAEAHAAGIVHRDLKPANLFLARGVGGEPTLKVLDFGVSKLLSGAAGILTTDGSTVGSPMYMAPEQMRASKAIDARADVWALGVVLFELLTGGGPFEADSLPDLCAKVVSEPPRSLAALRPDVPPGLAEVVERCLRKTPGERFANAADLGRALAPYRARPSRSPVAEDARGSADTIPAPPPDAPRRPAPRALWHYLAAACAVITLLSFAICRSRPRLSTSDAAPVEAPALDLRLPFVPRTTSPATEPAPAPSLPARGHAASPLRPSAPPPSQPQPSAPDSDIPAFR